MPKKLAITGFLRYNNVMDKTILASLPSEANNYILNLESDITRLQAQVTRLEELLRAANDALYGRSSEKTRYVLSNPNQLTLFNEAEACTDDTTVQEELVVIKTYARKKKRTKEELAKELPVIEEIIDLPEGARGCNICESEMHPIGKELVRRELCVTPAKAYVKEIYTVNYACGPCAEESEQANIVKPEVPVPVINRGLGSPSSVAYTIYQKFVNALPFDRQEKDWANFGVQISRATLANWVIYVSIKWLSPLYAQLKAVLVCSAVIQSDDTPVQVLHEPDKAPESESRMWVYRTGTFVQTHIILFEYQPDKAGERPKAFLEKAPPGFYLQTDGCASYNKVVGAIHCGCMAHLRRKLVEALPPTDKQESLAAKGLDFILKLFALEDEFKELTPENRLKERLTRSKPVLDGFFAWVDSVNPLAGSKLGTAITYARNQQKPLSAFLLDGRISIHNNASENAIRPFVRGRNNWLFSDSVPGAEASAVCYSIVETAKANGINPFKYLNYLFCVLPTVLTKNPDADLTQFFPWSVDTRERCRARDPVTGRLVFD